ncbi:MAG: hypothetical protein WC488_04585 [Candidatus Micrarchaeia archaeon]
MADEKKTEERRSIEPWMQWFIGIVQVSERASHGGSATGQAGAVEARRGVVG